MNNSQVILHITDVHFSKVAVPKNDARTLALDQLADTVAKQPDDWHPSLICLTGDLALRGKADDYRALEAWLTNLMQRFLLPKEALFICPGNHDVDRDKANQLARPGLATEADTVLAFPPITAPYHAVFNAYSEWAKAFGVLPYQLGSEENYLAGQRLYKNISFVALNTAWCSKDDSDKGKLWIGLPQIRHLEANKQFTLSQNRSALPVTVTLLHHPSDWLNPDESNGNASPGRPNVWNYLGVRSDVVLSGHAHGEAAPANTIAETALHFAGGATWQDETYFNNFRLLRIENDRVAYRTFEFDGRSIEQRWNSRVANEILLPRRSSGTNAKEKLHGGIGEANVALLREKTKAYAARMLELKSRAIRPAGDLPSLTTLQVAIAIPQEQHEPPIVPSPALQKRGHLEQGRLFRLPFAEALAKSRRTLLLGELGTGKSTFAAGVVESIQATSKNSIAFVMPAKQLDLPEYLTAARLLDSFSHFVSAAIAPSLPPVDVRTLLQSSIETTILVDGLDEIPNEKVRSLLAELAALPEHWPNLRVIATGRPIELGGSVYVDWQIVTAPSLTEEDKLAIFHNEAVADGEPPDSARQMATNLLHRLKTMPTLDQVISTPLAARLFYSRIARGSVTDVLTLGDLVYDIIEDRLGGWSGRDTKQKTTEFFEKYFPDAQSRSALLGGVVLELGTREQWNVGEVRDILASKLKPLGAVSEACTVEALDFFAKSGLVVVDDSFQFPVKVLLQMLRGIGIEQNWRSNSEAREIAVDQWREVSFAATVARRRSHLAVLGSYLERYITILASQENFVPAAAHIVSESNDPRLGAHFVSEARLRRATKIVFFEDAWDESARTIASALKISGSAGFDWFYERYLNPKYPFVQVGSALTGSVFREWVRLSIGGATEDEKQKVRELVIPILKADTLQVHDIGAAAVFLVPEVFDTPERLTFLARGLDTPQFSKIAEDELRKCWTSSDPKACDAALLGVASPLAALLWLEHNTDAPPVALHLTCMKALTDFRNDYGKRLADACVKRLGPERWTALLRFSLSHPDNKVAAGAALALFDLGERSFALLREPLVKALHDGGYVRRAEEILHDLLRHSDIDEVRWLAKTIHDRFKDLSGSHSGEMRLLLENIERVPEGPALLAWSIIGLGEFILPRYPEIRQRFRDLFSGPRGDDFRDAFHQAMQSHNPLERRAAAAVLVTCFPNEESLALQAVVRATAGGLGMRWREWEEYLLSLNFGPAPLVALKTKLDDFPAAAARFGYRLLLNSGVDLNVEQRKRATQGILAEYWYRVRETEFALLKSSETASHLLSLVKSQGDLSPKAADLLLQFHRPMLSEEEFALCASLTLTRDWWNRQTLSAQLEQLRSDPSYSQAVANLGTKHLQEKSTRLLLDMLRISLQDTTIWHDIVWELMCKERSLDRVEDPGYWLLEVGWQDPSAGQAIGKAADKFMGELSTRPNWSADVYQWLALLADEFIHLPQPQLEKIVLSSRPIHREVTAALLFRLGKIPAQFHSNRWTAVHAALHADACSEAELVDIVRPMDSFPSGICDRIEATVADRPISEGEITKLKQAGSTGALIASVLAFTQRVSPDPQYMILTLPTAALARRPHQLGCIDRLLSICKTSQYEYLKSDPEMKAMLMDALAKAFATENEIAEAAILLLGLRGYLSGDEARRFFEFILQRSYAIDADILEAAVHWLTEIPSKYVEHKAETLRALRVSLATVAENIPDKHPNILEEAIIWMMLALGFWLLSDQENESATTAFWEGLKLLFKIRSSENLAPMAQAFEILEPLLRRVRAALLRSAIQSRRTDSDPVVGASFALFQAFGGQTAD